MRRNWAVGGIIYTPVFSSMLVAPTKRLTSIATFLLSPCASAEPECPLDQIVVRGRSIIHRARSKFRVQLVYARSTRGESANIRLETAKFTLFLDFLTPSRRADSQRSF
jgi:hypothetical protein